MGRACGFLNVGKRQITRKFCGGKETETKREVELERQKLFRSYMRCLLKHLIKERVKLEIVDLKKHRRGKYIIKTHTWEV